MLKKIIVLLSVFVSSNLFAGLEYYPTAFKKTVIEQRRIKDKSLKEVLFEILSNPHLKTEGEDDTVVRSCNSLSIEKCVPHQKIAYSSVAMRSIYGKIHLERDGMGYYLIDSYCGKMFRPPETQIGPGLKPEGDSELSIEHTFPQNRFSSHFPENLQKGDLHHLYPAHRNTNSARQNSEFGEVVDGGEVKDCPGTYNGRGLDTEDKVFEPRDEHKGNAARAMFYFAIRYKKHIFPREEAVLRKWHELDPVDDFERYRNNVIEKIQGNRNPFIDYPELVDQISNF